MNTSELVLVSPEITAASAELSVPVEKSAALFEPFRKPYAAAAELLLKESAATDAPSARRLRLDMVKARTAIVGAKNTAKADVIIIGKVIDWYHNKGVAQLTEAEARLEEIEKAAERAAAKIKAELKAEREKLLAPFGVNTAFYALDSMPQDAFDWLLSEQKTLADMRAAEAAKAEAARVEALRVAEEARIAKEKADAEERARVIAENARLKAEADERERLAAIERKKAADELAAAEAAAKIEREKAEQAAKEAAEIARKEREAIEAKAKAEREAIEAKARAEKAEADRVAKVEREKREALELAERQRIAVEKARQEKEAAELARAAAAPDKEKLAAFASLLESIELPELSTKAGKVAGASIADELQRVIELVHDKIKSL